MSTPRSRLDDALRSLEKMSVPPPSRALMDLVRAAPAVPRRRPLRLFGVVLLVSLIVLALHIHSHDVRHDFSAISKPWFWTMTGAWFAAFVVPLVVALVPRRGAMFVSSRAAQLVALAIPILALAMAVLFRIDAPPATRIPKTTTETLLYIEWCLVTGLEMSAIPFALGVLVLLRAPLSLQTRWVGAALGAANGALAGLMLHVHCWVGGGLHCGVSHAGQSVLGAVIGALLVPALVKEGSYVGGKRES